jgi:hypothetical protein
MTNATIDDLINRLDTLPFDQAHTLVLHVLDTDPGMIEDERVRRWVSANSKAILDVVRQRVRRYEHAAAHGNVDARSYAVHSRQQLGKINGVLTGDGKAVSSQTRSAAQTKRLRHPDTCQCPACRPFIYPRR